MKIEDKKNIENYKKMEKEREKTESHKDKSNKSRGVEKKKKRLEDMSKEELLEEIKDIRSKAGDNYDLYMSTYAEMENFKKRERKEREGLVKYANESLIKEILPVIDNLENAISHARNDNNHSGLIEGVELTLDGLMKTLQKAGIKEIEAEGKVFDPNFQGAISQQTDDKIEPGHVIREFQKGYLLNGRLLRPSKVIVSQGDKKDSKENEK